MRLGETRFTLIDQERFAELSGDRNPMHLDPLAARRTQAGAPVVHGIHGMLWALDLLAQAGKPFPRALQARFEAFLYLNVDVQAILRQLDGRTTIHLESRGRRVTTISLLEADAVPRTAVAAASAEPVPDRPLDLDFAEISEARGAMRLRGTPEDYAAAFPRLAAAVGATRVRAIASLSTLVGMRLPGLHSMFSKCAIRLSDDVEAPDILRFAVRRARPPLRQLTIACAGGGLVGTIEAFVRHPPVLQPSLDKLEHMSQIDLRGQRALVVGGSRGLGELTAKLAALAGADVTVTYARGKEEAVALCSQLTARGLSCRARALDVTRLADAALAVGEFTHLYYYATPAIFSRTTDRYDAARFHTFGQYYCDAFEELCRRVQGEGGLKAFWPSSTAIDEVPRGMIEYIMAKLAGESLCREMERANSKLRILTVRFPRLPTDQTSSVTPVAAGDPVALVQRVLSELA